MHSDRDVTHPGVLLGALSLGRLTRRGRISALLMLSLYGSLIGGASACSSDSTGPNHPVLASAQAFWALRLNQHAVMLALTAPVNTIQLTATPLNADGTPLSGLGPVHYKASDTTINVDGTGLVTAQFTTQSGRNSFVTASLTDPKQNVTLVDTCYIRVTETAPTSRLASFSIQPINGDSAKLAILSGGYTVQARATDGSNAAYTDFFAYFYTSDNNIATFYNQEGLAVDNGVVGQVTFYAQTWSYGVAAVDSLKFDWTVPLNYRIEVLPFTPTGSSTPVWTFWPQSVTVGVGARIQWEIESYTDSIDVVFDDPTNVDSLCFLNFCNLGFDNVPATGSGNISPWVDDTTLAVGDTSIANRVLAWTRDNFDVCHEGDHRCGIRNRRFPVAGIYHYHSRIQHTTGTVIVQ